MMPARPHHSINRLAATRARTFQRGRRARRGMVLAAVLVCLFILLLITAGLLRTLVLQHRQVPLRYDQMQAQWLAESGVNLAQAELLRDATYRGEVILISANLDRWQRNPAIKAVQARAGLEPRLITPMESSRAGQQDLQPTVQLASITTPLPPAQPGSPTAKGTLPPSATPAASIMTSSAEVAVAKMAQTDLTGSPPAKPVQDWTGRLTVEIVEPSDEPTTRLVRIEAQWRGRSSPFASTHRIETEIPLSGLGAAP